MKKQTIYLPNPSIVLLSKQGNKLTYRVPRDISKTDLSQVLLDLYNIKAVKLNIINKLGKHKKNIFGIYKKKSFKKVIVTI